MISTFNFNYAIAYQVKHVTDGSSSVLKYNVSYNFSIQLASNSYKTWLYILEINLNPFLW